MRSMSKYRAPPPSFWLLVVVFGICSYCGNSRSGVSQAFSVGRTYSQQQRQRQHQQQQQRQQQQGFRTRMTTTTTTHVAAEARSIQDLMNFENDDDDDDDDDDDETTVAAPKKLSRWEQLNPSVQKRIRKAAQQRAIQNKQKNEPIQNKKRKLLMFVKQKQQEKKNAARIPRPLSFDDRTPLAALIPGMEMRGVVISLTPFGAYVDVGTECDGLLHVSQLTQEVFVEHPRQVLTPGDKISVRVRSLNAQRKKLHLTMLPAHLLQADQRDQQQQQQRIPLSTLMVDDELWGEVQRVTDFGAYVEIGAMVHGWLHFMDHPSWQRGTHPSQFINTGDRVRVWVADVDLEQKRVKLTANRPPHLPGPRREFP